MAATQKDVPVPGVTARRHFSPGVNEAAWEKGVN